MPHYHGQATKLLASVCNQSPLVHLIYCCINEFQPCPMV